MNESQADGKNWYKVKANALFYVFCILIKIVQLTTGNESQRFKSSLFNIGYPAMQLQNSQDDGGMKRLQFLFQTPIVLE